MKKLMFLFCTFSPIVIHAQLHQNEYLLENFTVSVATMKKGPPIRDSFNYNYAKQEMHFMKEDGEILKLQSINDINTLYLGDHKMIPYNGRFLDVIHTTPQYKILLDYKIKKINKGRKGAMGTTTQGTVETIDLSKAGIHDQKMTMQDNAVYDYKDETSYLFQRNGKIEKIKDAKSFIKLFPDKKVQIDTYIKDQKISFKDTDAIISLIEFSLN
ncbi:MAG: hypothetical protein LUD02_06480 [Tannerellaceae bacterium]|nr:hypothetical protein [Tannerellaceae bacterium]